jgi:hypothetical protein
MIDRSVELECGRAVGVIVGECHFSLDIVSLVMFSLVIKDRTLK